MDAVILVTDVQQQQEYKNAKSVKKNITILHKTKAGLNLL